MRLIRAPRPVFASLLVFALVVSFAQLTPPVARANEPVTYWVDVAAGVDTNPGTEAQPFKTITKACSVAWSEDTIMVEPGEYNEASGESLPIALYGPSLKSTGGASVTFIQGNESDQLVSGQNFAEGDEISGFTFSGGRGANPGGALSVYLSQAMGTGSLRIADNVFEDNKISSFAGGAIDIFASDADAHHVTIERNLFLVNFAGAGSPGGAIHMGGDVSGNTDLLLSDNTFEGNMASVGGAVMLSNCPATIVDNAFLSNIAGTGGGALSIYGGDSTRIRSNTFLDNHAAHGGAVELDLCSGTVIGNNAGGNIATNEGGFAVLQDSTMTAVNNVIDANAASIGAAWWLGNVSTLNEINDTVIHHEDASVATWATDLSTLTITNSIYWNHPTIPNDVEGADSLSYSCVSDTNVGMSEKRNVVGAGVIFDDPRLVDDATKPAPELLVGSPCIDTADPGNVADSDIYGTERPLDGDGDGIAESDMGCFEYAPPSAEVEHDAAGVIFDRWVTGYSTAYSGGGYVYGRWTGTRLDAKFTGGSVKWVGPKQPGYGMADVYIDDVLVATDVDCYASNADKTLSATIWESATLTDGPHTISIRLTGAKNAASSGNVVVIDRFQVTGAAPQGLGTRIDDSLADPGYTGSWLTYANPTYFNKTYAYSRWTNAAFTATFTGTKVAWIGPRTPNYGIADVLIDDVKVATVDTYRADLATQGWREVVWESEALSAGEHTIAIKPLGTKNPASTAANVVIDAIDVTQ